MKTSLGQDYSSFHIEAKEEIIESDGQHAPCYLGEENQAYDKYYRIIKQPIQLTEEMHEIRKDIFTHREFAQIFNPEEEYKEPIPMPLTFNTYKEYYMALSEWHYRKIKQYSSALLPIPINGLLYAPIKAKVFTKEEKANPSRFRTFKAQQWPLLPNNYTEMLQLIEKNEEINPDQEFHEQYPKREVIYMKHHITSSPQWMEQRVPHEPIPEFYDTLEEYELAYKRWATIADEMHRNEIPTIEEMETIAMIDEVEPVKTATSEPATEVPPCLYDKKFVEFAKNATFTESKIEPILKKFKKPCKDEESSDDEPVYQRFVYGVDPDKFVKDMIDFGMYRPSTSILRPCHPIDHHVYVNGDLSDAERIILNTSEFSLDIITSIIRILISNQDLIQLLKYNVNGAEASEQIFKFLTNKKHLRGFIARTELSQSIKYASSQFLLVVMTQVRDAQPLTVLLEDNIKLFHSFVNLLCVASSEVHSIYNLFDERNSKYDPIIKGYLFSIIYEIFSKESETSIYDISRAYCQRYSNEIAKLIKNDAIHEQITADLNSNTMNDGTRAALMILNISSPHVHRILFSHSFIEWINEMSKFRNGVIFIETLSYSNALDALALLITGPLGATIDGHLEQLTEQACYCIRRILYHLFSLCERINISFNGTNLVKILDNISSSQRECLSVLVAPIAQIIVQKKMISNYKDQSQTFLQILQNSVTKLCNATAQSTNTQFRQQLQALMILSSEKSCSMVMSNSETFMLNVVQHLKSNDSNTMFLSWTFFEQLSKDTHAFRQVTEKEKIRVVFGDIPSAKSNIALRNMLAFSFNIWKSGDMVLIGAWNKAVVRPVKVIASCYIDRKLRYRNDKRLQILLEQFINIIEKNKNSEFKELKEAVYSVMEDYGGRRKK